MRTITTHDLPSLPELLDEAARRARWRHAMLPFDGPSPGCIKADEDGASWITSVTTSIYRAGEGWHVAIYGEHATRRDAAERALARLSTTAP